MLHRYAHHISCAQHGASTVPLDVNLGLAPTWFELDSHGVLTTTMWLKLTWRDYRLSWLPDLHENISMIRYMFRDQTTVSPKTDDSPPCKETM